MARQPRSSSFSSSSTCSRCCLDACSSNSSFFSSQPCAISSTESSVSGRPEVLVICRMCGWISTGTWSKYIPMMSSCTPQV